VVLQSVAEPLQTIIDFYVSSFCETGMHMFDRTVPQ